MHGKLVAGAAAAVALIGSGAASAAIPSAAGTLHGCVNNATGVLRVVDEAKSGNLGQCITTGAAVLRETAVDWNQTGPAGPPGEPGAPGAPGAAGRDAPVPLEVLITRDLVFPTQYLYTEAGTLIVSCDQASYDVRYQMPQPGLTPADVWIEQSSGLDHAAMPATAPGQAAVHDVVRGAVADDHLAVRASVGAAVTEWHVWATTEGGCRLSVTESTATYSPDDTPIR
jgi:hypothetical protein